MVTIITLGVIGVVIAAVVGIILFLVGIPLMIIGSILPWVLTLVGVVMLIKGRSGQTLPLGELLSQAWWPPGLRTARWLF